MNEQPPTHHSFLSSSNEVRIHFPFEPYQVQREYMNCVVDVLSNKGHALLESPTGTGKTLSLLCSTLAWLQAQPNPTPMVYYASRTHVQLAQAAKEMKRTAYAKIPSVVLAGRSSLCLNDDVKHQPGGQNLINRACRNALAKNACVYYLNYEQKLGLIQTNTVHDIEDLISFGRKNQCCPYYSSKKFAESKASLVFTPYNYLLDSSLRRSLELKLKNSVIIFDEAHNIEGSLKDCVSSYFGRACLETIIECCLRLPQMVTKALENEKGISRLGYEPKPGKIVDEFKKPKQGSKEKESKVNPIEALADKLTFERLRAVQHCATSLISQVAAIKLGKYEIHFFYDVLKECDINFSTSTQLLETLDSSKSFLQMAGVQSPALVDRYVSALTNLSESVWLFYPSSCTNLKNLTDHQTRMKKFYVGYIEPIKNDKVKDDWKMYFWCLYPAIGLREMIDSSADDVRSLIITSGTLAPITTFEDELDIKFRVKRSFPHIIDQKQMKIVIIGKSPSGQSLESSRAYTEKNDYPDLLGSSLIPIFKVLPFGTIAFFQSYSLMDRVMKVWKENSNVWLNMNKLVRVFVEDRRQETFISDLAAFKRCVDGSGNAVFFGVCRGKLSEGVNLEGNYCRTVLITGLPFPALKDPKVELTRQFYSHWKNDPRGSAWYTLQMNRALNQTIGRVIRSQSDFGLVLLCDPRFQTCSSVLSQWIQRFFPSKSTEFSDVDRSIKGFFEVHGLTLKGSTSEDVGAFEIGFSGAQPPKQRASNGVAAISSLSDQQESTRPKTLQEQKAQMIASYTVTEEVLKKIKASRVVEKRKATETVVPGKKARPTEEVFEVLFDVVPIEEEHNNISSTPKPPIKSNNLFKKKQPTQPGPAPGTSNESQARSSQNSTGSNDYSILEQRKNMPQWYYCEFCKNPCETPYRTECRCARVGCKKCIRILHNKQCLPCNEKLDKKKFKPVFFKSAYFNRNKQKRILTQHKQNIMEQTPILTGQTSKLTEQKQIKVEQKLIEHKQAKFVLEYYG